MIWHAARIAHWAVYVGLVLFSVAHLVVSLQPAGAHGWLVSGARLFCPLHR